MSEMAFDHVKRITLQLWRSGQARLAAWLVETAGANAPAPGPSRPLYGLWAELGPGPSGTTIDEARQEVWGTFPRRDIA